MKVDDMKPKKEKNIDSIENTCDDEVKDLQKDESIHNEEEDKEKEDTQEYEEYFRRPDTKTPSRRVQKDLRIHKSWVIQMLESKQEDNYQIWNKPYSQ